MSTRLTVLRSAGLVLALSTPLASATAAPPPSEPPPPTCASPTIVGTPGNDVIVGTPGPDVIDAGVGNDTVSGRGGDDIICGGDGRDTLDGGPGDDQVSGGDAGDLVIGGIGSDTLWGGSGADELYTRGVTPSPDTDPASIDVVYDGGGGLDTMTMDAGIAQLHAVKRYSHVVVRGRPGPGTVLSGGNVDLAPSDAVAGGRTISVDFAAGTIDLDGGVASMPDQPRVSVRGTGATRVEALGSDDHDSLSLTGVADASTHLGAGDDDVTVVGGAAITHMDLDLGAASERNSITVVPDTTETVVDLGSGAVSYDGRPTITLRGGSSATAASPSLGSYRHGSVVLRGSSEANQLQVVDGFQQVLLEGLGGDDRLGVVPTQPTPGAPTPTVRLDGGPGNDYVESRLALALQTVVGGAGDDDIHVSQRQALVSGGAGLDTCWVTTARVSCETIKHYR